MIFSLKKILSKEQFLFIFAEEPKLANAILFSLSDARCSAWEQIAKWQYFKQALTVREKYLQYSPWELKWELC